MLNSIRNHTSATRIAAEIATIVSDSLFKNFPEISSEDKKINDLVLKKSLQKVLTFNLLLLLYRKQVLSSNENIDSFRGDKNFCIYSQFKNFYHAARDEPSFWHSLNRLASAYCPNEIVLDLMCSQEEEDILETHFHDLFGNSSFKYKAKYPFKIPIAIKILFRIESLSKKYFVKFISFINSFSSRKCKEVYWMGTHVPRQDDYYLRIPGFHHRVIESPEVKTSEKYNVALRQQLIYECINTIDIKKYPLFEIQDISTGLYLLPTTFIEGALENSSKYVSYVKDHKLDLKCTQVFSAGSSFQSNYIFLESTIQALGLSTIVIQHGACSGYTYTSSLITWTSIDRASKFASNFNSILEPDFHLKTRLVGPIPSFQFLLATKSIVKKVYKIKQFFQKRRPSALLALGAIYNFNPLNECFYSFSLAEYRERVLELVNTLDSYGFNVTIKDYDSASTQTMASLYQELELIPCVSSLYSSSRGELTALEISHMHDVVFTDVVSGLFAECCAIHVPVYAFLPHQDQYTSLNLSNKLVSSLLSKNIISMSSDLLCGAAYTEIYNSSHARENSDLRIKFVQEFNCAGTSPKLPFIFKLLLAFKSWSFMFNARNI